MVVIELLAEIGFVLSLYALYAEWKVEKDPSYKTICDFSEKMSCSAAFKSPYGKIFGIPNPVFGLGFYLAVLVLALLGMFQYVFYLSVLSLLASIYLAYILYLKLKNFCLVCNAIYLVNILLVVFSAILMF